MSINPDEEIPVRGFTDYGSLTEDDKFSVDEDQQGTLKNQYFFIRDEIKKLRSFDVFDITETELKLKQQIKAHRLALDILEPIAEAMQQALATVDEKFRQRNNK